MHSLITGGKAPHLCVQGSHSNRPQLFNGLSARVAFLQTLFDFSYLGKFKKSIPTDHRGELRALQISPTRFFHQSFN